MDASGKLVIIGSGELGPSMVRVHQQILSRLDGVDGPLVALDTPYAFQENVAELSAKTVDYFARFVGTELEVASLGPGGTAAGVDRVRRARLVFAGPGSPSYALRFWQPSGLAGALARRLAEGGAVVFASAAAATLGRWALPVYEMYKAGADPHWLEGLDLLSVTGLAGVVVPHWDNAEGGTHDTSRCYVGRRRLAVLERQLPPGAVVLGVDEHTAALIDLGTDTVTVTGKGGLTARRRGAELVAGSGDSVPLEALRTLSGDLADPDPVPVPEPPADPAAPALTRLEAALAAGEAAGAAAVAADALEAALAGRATEDVVRAVVARLAQEAAAGRQDVVAAALPHVDAVLALRDEARAAGDFARADAVRDLLDALGIEVRDTPDGAAWERRA